LADVAPINWTNAVTLISVAILVGTELVGAGAAAGWAIGGLFQLGETITRSLEGVLILTALTGLFYFLRAEIAFRDGPRRPWGRICAAANRPAIAQFWNANCGTQSAKRAPGRFGRNPNRPG
jgi:hypothetical protein